MILTLVNKKQETETIKTFFFESNEKVNYQAGKFLYLTLPHLKYPDARGEMRHFSLSSSPTEKLLSFSIRIAPNSSGYKKTLDELSVGSKITGDGPHGIYSWPVDPEKYHFFIAGGVGITPIRSRIKYVYDKSLKTKMFLLYSCRDTYDIAFRQELETVANSFPDFKLEIVLTRNGKGRRIDKKMLKKLIPHTETLFWVCGAPQMVTDIENMLESIGVDNQMILTEKFTGY